MHGESWMAGTCQRRASIRAQNGAMSNSTRSGSSPAYASASWGSIRMLSSRKGSTWSRYSSPHSCSTLRSEEYVFGSAPVPATVSAKDSGMA
jgi:hypothetical protein